MRRPRLTKRIIFVPILLALIGVGTLLWLSGGIYRQTGILLFILGTFTLAITLLYQMLFWGDNTRRVVKAEKLQERQKQTVWSRGIPDLINALYHSYVIYYPDWIKHSNEYFIPSVIKSAERFPDGRIKIVTLTNAYIFWFYEDKFAIAREKYHVHGRLEIFSGEQKVFALHLAKEEHNNLVRWRPASIDIFTEGEWLSELTHIYKEIVAERRRDSRES